MDSGRRGRKRTEAPQVGLKLFLERAPSGGVAHGIARGSSGVQKGVHVLHMRAGPKTCDRQARAIQQCA